MADTISTLPDSILSHILSFLNTKQSVATSILSKRWNHLYLSVPVLDFSHTTLTDQTANFRFNDFVYSILLSRDSTLPIKKFWLYVKYDYFESNNFPIPSFTKWINFVLQRGVEDLILHVGMAGWPILPITIFTCKTLVSLKLDFFHVEYNFELVELPSLKTLNLRFITFVEDLDFMLLLDGCPMLEYLFIEDLFYEYEDEESLRCNTWKNFSLSKLRGADVDHSYCHFPLKSLQNVRSMSFEIAQEYCCKDAIPTFHNLIDLDLDCLNYRWHILVEVLKHCPKLQSLSINQTGMNMDEFSPTRKDDKESWVEPDFVPQCLSLHLRTCHIFSFLGLQSELLLAKYILKNARVLQTMKIFIIGQPKIRRLLSSSPRASSTCKLTFHLDPSEYC